jgi:hypothetical protein
MTIRKGEAWGASDGPEPSAHLTDDSSLAAHVAAERGAVVSVSHGDLHRTLGLGDVPRREPLWFPMDLGWVSLDGGPEQPFVAHALARSRTWSGAGAAIMNAAWIGDRYLGPRAHPNDGLLDITFGALPPRQLVAAARRAKTGMHLPHPALSVRRVGSWSHTFDRPRFLWLDGCRSGNGRRIECRVEADWFTLVG